MECKHIIKPELASFFGLTTLATCNILEFTDEQKKGNTNNFTEFSSFLLLTHAWRKGTRVGAESNVYMDCMHECGHILSMSQLQKDASFLHKHQIK